MTRLAALLTTSAHVAHRRAAARRLSAGPRDRGDVPGWVLITVMTAGLVTAIWLIAGPALQTLFTNAVNGVKGK